MKKVSLVQQSVQIDWLLFNERLIRGTGQQCMLKEGKFKTYLERKLTEFAQHF